MINGNDEQNLEYLLDPCFQIVNTHGAPLTSGWLEVYIHGTRTKYYCASDFDGTLHPFKIPLDSLGSNIVLADPSQSYDVYVYNKFGTLIMSRYNVTPGRGGGGISGAVKTEIISESIDVTKTYDPETNTNIFDIELKNNGESQHWIGQNGSSIVIDPDEEDQNERTLPFPTSQNRDYIGSFVNRIVYGKFMYLEPGLYLVNCVIDFHQDIANLENEISQVLVYTGAGNANEDVAFERDDTGPDTSNNRHCLKMTFIRKVLGEDETSHIDCSNLLYFAPKTEVLWNQCSIKKLSIVKLDQGDGFSRVIHDDTIEGDGTEDNPLTVSGTVNHIYEVITSATSGKLDSSAYVAPVQSDWNENDQSDLSYIKNKPTECSLIAGQNVWLEDMTSGVRINCSASGGGGSGVTEEYVQQAVASGTSGKLDIEYYTPPVQSDWNQSNAAMLDYIKNKPAHSELLEGPGINITASGNDFVISTSGSVSEQYVQDAISSAVSDLPSTIYVDETVQSATSGKLDTSAYTAPVQSDWTEPDAAALSFIKNKPTECSLIAGENVWLEDMTSGVRINCSASGGGGGGSYTAGEFIDITNDVISVNSGDVSNLIPGSGILITQSSAGTTVAIDPEELPAGGYNETVLWSGEVSVGQTAELSEDYSAFNEIKFKYRDWNPTDGASNHTERFDTDATKFVTICGWQDDANTIRAVFIGSYSATDANHIKLTSVYYTNGGTTWSSGTGGYRLLQIVGINRKES